MKRNMKVSGILSSLEKRVQTIDAFGESYNMRLDTNQKNTVELKTLIGSFITIIIFFVVGAYSLQKADVWINNLEEYIM